MAKSSGNTKSATVKGSHGNGLGMKYLSSTFNSYKVGGFDKGNRLKSYENASELICYPRLLYNPVDIRPKLLYGIVPKPIDMEEWFRKYRKKCPTCDGESAGSGSGYGYNFN